jgi:aspartyl/asparaginyl beta-hydroxylase (cupin superfamily)
VWQRLSAQGWAALANHVLRCHLPLVVPGSGCEETGEPGAEFCGIVVDGETTFHTEGELIVFDDSKKHYAFNRHPTHSRVVLIFDIARPEELPLGCAQGPMTAELGAFIDYFK